MTILLTVITVNKNNAVGLENTLRTALPKQKMQELQYIVVDGNSNDGSIETIKSNRDKLDKFIIEDDLGVFHAMNKGLEAAKGEYILFLNSGDTLVRCLNSLLDIVRNDPSIDVFYSDVAIKPNRKIEINYNRMLLMHHCLNHQNMIVKRKFLKSGYNLNYRFSADVKWQIDFLHNLKLKKLSEPIAYFELDGLSSNKRRDVVEKIWRERWLAHYTTSNDAKTFRLVALLVTSLIYIVKVLMPKFLSRAR